MSPKCPHWASLKSTMETRRVIRSFTGVPPAVPRLAARCTSSHGPFEDQGGLIIACRTRALASTTIVPSWSTVPWWQTRSKATPPNGDKLCNRPPAPLQRRPRVVSRDFKPRESPLLPHVEPDGPPALPPQVPCVSP